MLKHQTLQKYSRYCMEGMDKVWSLQPIASILNGYSCCPCMRAGVFGFAVVTLVVMEQTLRRN